MNFRLAILIAIGPSNGGRAHWIIANDSTPRLAGLCPTSRGADGKKLAVFLRCKVSLLARFSRPGRVTARRLSGVFLPRLR
jgi:hypothetical protein